MGYTISRTIARSFPDALAEVRDALAEQGFGVLTEIDVAETMKVKLDVDVPAQVILGACRPQLAHQAMGIDASISTVLPCNVVVRSVGESTTVVEAFDPAAMTELAGAALAPVATEARTRLTAVLDTLAQED